MSWSSCMANSLWDCFPLWSSPCEVSFDFLWFLTIFFQWGRGWKNEKTFSTIFSPFQAIWNNFVFFVFLTILFWTPHFFFGGGGYSYFFLSQKFKNLSRPNFSPFQAIWNNFNFFKIFFCQNPKIIFDQFSHHFRKFLSNFCWPPPLLFIIFVWCGALGISLF